MLKTMTFAVCGFILLALIGNFIMTAVNPETSIDKAIQQDFAFGCIGLIAGALIGRMVAKKQARN